MHRSVITAALAMALTLVSGQLAFSQSQVEMLTVPRPAPRLEIAPQGEATREGTRPSEADFYREDMRIRHEPAFIEPFVTRTPGGSEVGLSGWTAPATPVGSLASQGHGQNNGWFSLGITFVWDSPPRATARPTAAPR